MTSINPYWVLLPLYLFMILYGYPLNKLGIKMWKGKKWFYDFPRSIDLAYVKLIRGNKAIPEWFDEQEKRYPWKIFAVSYIIIGGIMIVLGIMMIFLTTFTEPLFLR